MPSALITGASSGIGAALAPLFASDGYDLVLVSRSEAKLCIQATQLERDYGIACHVVPQDLAEPDAPDKSSPSWNGEALRLMSWSTTRAS